MVRGRLQSYHDRAREQLIAAFREDHTPRQVAASFALGMFVTALPTAGFGIGLFFVLVSIFSWISKPAIFAAVAVLNPVVKPAIYVASFQVGGLFVSAPSVTDVEPTTETATVAVQQLLIGNVLIAVVLSVVSYGVVVWLTRVHRARTTSPVASTLPVVGFLFGRR